jgi:acyl transferase domain-containing protein/NADPH:quinone reductase-like Zn-dependent oxidoreductase/acyl carrier protein/NADP-dependent 3-hydroxy acid dehydrogenase YdfG
MSDGSIAIVGAACRFPGAPDLAAFWELLATGTDAVSEVDPQRWSTRFFYHPTPGEPARSYTWSAGLIDGVDLFEPAFFGISPREAAQMDPQQRILLELVWHAAEDAGIPAARLAGSAFGVYIGASTTDYRDLRFSDPASGDSYFMTGGTLSILANRISHVFDLRGPSLALDTACSSSMVALHHACEAIRAGRIAGAVVGGINLLLAPYPFLGFCRAGMLSRRGRCFAFDARADGYVRGEGGAAVILKPLEQAVADGDPIRAVILGTGANSDGRTIGLSLPSEAAQAALIRAVCERAGVTPDDLAFFEMHGTGTPAGDPIEAAAVGAALGRARGMPLPIGSVKTNIGHLEPASGMAGLLKAALALDRGVLPATLHCEEPNPDIPFDRLNLRPARRLETIAAGRCAGVNSFGFGGTNAHAILAAPPRRAVPPAAGAAAPPLLLSARSDASLRELAQRWQATLAAATPERVPAMVRAAARGRDHHGERLVVLAGTPAATAAALADFAAGAEHPALVAGTAVRDGRLAFAFSGNGAQWPEMGRDAWRTSAAFRDAVSEVDGLLRPLLGWSAADAITSGVEDERLARADVAQPLLFATQVGIVAVLRRLGIAAAGHIGHSVGEIAAAWSAGALSLADAARVIAARSRQQERTRGAGRMAVLALDAAAAQDLVADLGGRLEIGAVNASRSVTVSGPGEAIERLAGEARRRGIACRPLALDFAFHSAAMDGVRDDLLRDLTGLRSGAPASLLVSTVTGAPVGDGDLDARYWWRNIRRPVCFADGMAALTAAGFRIFLEIGPNPVLQAYLKDALGAADDRGRVLATLTRRPDDTDPFPAIAARCQVAGVDISSGAAFEGPCDPAALPLYPWQKERFWFERTVEDLRVVDPPFDHPLLGFRQQGPAAAWLNHLDPARVPWLADHAIEGVPVLPAAAVLEMALAAARLRRPDAAAVAVVDVELRRPLPFDNGGARELRSAVAAEDGDFALSSRPRLAEEPMTLHAVARLAAAGDWQPPRGIGDPAAVGERIEGVALYRLAARLGLDYGPRFRTVRHVDLLADGGAAVQLDPSVIDPGDDGYIVHPALLDGALQGLLALLADQGGDAAGVSFLPWRFGRVRIAAPFGRQICRAELSVTRRGTRSASADIVLFDAAGETVGELSDCWFRRVELSRRTLPEDAALRVDLVPAPLAEGAAPAVLDRLAAIAARLASQSPAAVGRAAEQALLLDAAIASAALAALPAAIERDAPFTVDQLVASGIIAPRAAALFGSLLRLLERFGAAAAEASVWRIAARNELPELADVWRLLLAEAPDLIAELTLIAAATAELPRLLANGSRAPENALAATFEPLLYASPTGAASIEQLCDMLGEIAAQWPRERPLRILEIGAHGAATRRFLDRLAQSGAAFAYVATTSEADAAARLGVAVAGIAGAGARRWSPGEAAGDLGAGHFDVIVSLYACTRLGVAAAALAALHGRLAPGGVLLAAEPAPNALWDLALGRELEWWSEASDGASASPLRAGDGWRDELAGAGFVAVGSFAPVAGSWPRGLFWGRAATARATAGAPSPRTITLIAAANDSAAALAEQLACDGHRVRVTDPAAFVGGAEDAGDGAAGDDAIALFVAAMPGDGAGAIDSTARLLALVARVATAASRRQLPLWLVATGAQQPAAAADGALAGAALWGFGRVLLNEIPRLRLRLIDLAPAMDLSGRAAAIAAELTAADAETEIVWTAAGRHVLRLRRGLPPRWAKAGEGLALSGGPQGGIDALGWQDAAPRPLGPGEIAIDVAAAGLNFRDIMWAMALVPEEALIDGFTGPTFGLECAGVVSAVGAGVADPAIGDRVAGFAPAALGTRVTTAAQAVMHLPPEMSFAAAATLPVAFVTVTYALGTLAKLSPGETVLIHAAAGGVGLAAIQYAKYRGATVIATAGSAVKRAVLCLAGADHVLNSRDPGFADAVRAMTGGSGVDVVLNSLSGEAMEESLGVLKPFGRFLELGKRDFYLNRRIHLRPLRQNISYFAIDIDQLPVARPELAKALLDEVSAAVAAGAIRPLAHRRFPFAAVGDAFRLMQAAGHIGKLVLEPAGNTGVRLRPGAGFALRRDGTYLVTGGIAGFGFAAAAWLARSGAGSLALVGRRGAATPGAGERVAELRALGAQDVRLYAADVADPAALGAVLAEIRATQPPLRGVIHAAATIIDGMAGELDEAAIAAVLRPKIGGAVALDRLTRDDPVELFVLFSSATTLIGAPGQGAYVAANLALEALVRRRRAEGRPALAALWGPIEDAGHLAERPAARDALARRLGAKPLPAAEALAALPAMLDSRVAAAAFAATNWHEARRHLPILAAPIYGELCAEAEAAAGDESLLERLAGLASDERLALLKTAIAEEAATILRLPAAALDPQRPLSEIGMDSLMAVELRLALEARLRLDLPLMSLAEGTSVGSIAARLATALATPRQASEIVNLAERYETADAARLGAVASRAERFDRRPVDSAAAE